MKKNLDYFIRKLKPKHKFLCVTYDFEDCGPGLSDQTFQIRLYCMIAKDLGLDFILPQRYLHPTHNSDKKLLMNFSEYYEISSIKLNGENINVRESCKTLKNDEILFIEAFNRKNEYQNDVMNKLVDQYNPNENVTFDRCNQDILFAENIIKSNKIEGCLHIRRGDRCLTGAPVTNKYGLSLTGSEWEYATRPNNIFKLLKSTSAPRRLYIMTDMKHDDFHIKTFRESNEYDFTFLYDIPELVKIKDDNNYKAFNIEMSLQESSLISYKKNRMEVVMSSFREKQN